MVALLRLEKQVTGSKIVGAVALFKVPPQTTGLVHPFALAFVLSKDLADRSSVLPEGPERQGEQCLAGGQWKSMQGARGCCTQLAECGQADTEQVFCREN